MVCDWEVVEVRRDGWVLVTFKRGEETISHWFPSGYFTSK